MSTGQRLARGACVVAIASTIATASLLSCVPRKPAVATLNAMESWCPEGFEVGPQDTCFSVPETTTKNTPVLVYLHGMYTGHGSPEEWSLVRSAAKRGFAIVIPRGKRGLCAWKAELSDHFCWPQEVDDPQAYQSIVAEWNRVLWQVDSILEGDSHKRYVLGFSNGGFFAAYLAAHGIFPARAYAIVNGGSMEPTAKPASAPPVLLLAEDDASQSTKMRELHDGLTKVGWSHAFCKRPGGHSLTAQDIDGALKFFKQDNDGTPGPSQRDSLAKAERPLRWESATPRASRLQPRKTPAACAHHGDGRE